MRAISVAIVLLLALSPTVAASEPLPEPAEKDIYLPAYMHCLWKGSYKVLIDTPVVRVWHYTCDSPDV